MTPRISISRSGFLLLLLSLVAVLAACGDSSGSSSESAEGSSDLNGKTITVYSGRGEDLIQPVLDAFEAESGVNVEVRYLSSSDAALTIETEGDRSPADVVISQSPGAIGFLEQGGFLSELSSETLDRLAPEFRSSSGQWAGVTGRVRVLVYNTDQVSEDELPGSILDLTSDTYSGRVGVAPANGSFQDFVTAMRAELGDEETGTWLAGMANNDSPNYEKNSAIVDAVARGEVDMGLVNHYYLVEALDEDPSLPAKNFVFPDGDLGSLLIVSAAARLESSDEPEAAEALIQFLLSDSAQEMSANGEKEYPLVEGVAAPEGLEPLEDLAAVVVDLDVLAEGLSGTQEAIDTSGLAG